MMRSLVSVFLFLVMLLFVLVRPKVAQAITVTCKDLQLNVNSRSPDIGDTAYLVGQAKNNCLTPVIMYKFKFWCTELGLPCSGHEIIEQTTIAPGASAPFDIRQKIGNTGKCGSAQVDVMFTKKYDPNSGFPQEGVYSTLGNACEVVTPPPPSLSCEVEIRGDGTNKVYAGENKQFRVNGSGGVQPYKNYDWTAQATSGSDGTFSDPKKKNVSWTPPSPLTVETTWTITAWLKDAENSRVFCTKNVKFKPGAPPTSSEAFFQTFAGDVTALSTLSDFALPAGKAISGGLISSHSDAGVVVGSNATLNISGSKFSENGSGTGFHLSPYVSGGKLPTYQTLLNNFLRKAGFGSVEKIPGCANEENFSWDIYHIWCYGGNDLNSKIVEAESMDDGDSLYHVFIPKPGGNNSSIVLSTLFTGGKAINKDMLVFVDAGVNNLKIEKDLEVKVSGQKGAFMAIINGGVRVDPNVKKVDGFYYFSNQFSSGEDLTNKLEATGSIIGTAENSFAGPYGLLRKYVKIPPEPAETWTYDGKYIPLFSQLLTRTKIKWKALPGI